MQDTPRFLHSGFLRSVGQFPDRPALEIQGARWTYRQLHESATALARALWNYRCAEEPKLTAVFAYRSPTAFAAVLGALLRGHGYVPLNVTFPASRNRVMLERSGCRALIVDTRSETQLPEILEGFPCSLVVLLPDRLDVSDLRERWPRHQFVGAPEIGRSSPADIPVSGSPNDIAYLLFTSGSTGTPKGVMVAHRNVGNYIDFICQRYAIAEQDRFSQTFDMTFDLSVADMFVAWEKGACVCCPSQKALMAPGRFIVDSGLTIWFSVPSTAVFMQRLGLLKPGMYPKLRVSMFCGEAFPAALAQAWTRAAPNSIVENLYGPTELTIACILYRWESETSPGESELGCVPIGYPFPNMEVLVADEALNEVPIGSEGELLMTGPQLSLGYYKDPEKTAAAFVVPPARQQTFYKTGDRVRRPPAGKPLTYLGRLDHQIKVHGHRVELGEVEAVAREESGSGGVVAVGWPMTDSGAGGIEVFCQGSGLDMEQLRTRIAARLPAYMAPRRIHLMARLPLNANGKYDRKALIQILETNA